MNERIEAFIDQMSRTGLPYQAGDRELTVTGSDLEYFAELIVRECVGVVNKRYMGDNNREDMEVRRCVEDLRQHFGIEE